MITKNKRLDFMNIKIDNLSMQEALERIDQLVREKKSSYIVTPNVDHIVRVEKDPLLKLVYDNASLVLTDGKPLIWISKLYGKPIKEKISGSDLFPLLCEMSAKRNYRLFFIGAAEGVARRVAVKLLERYENLKVVGTYSPPLGFEKDKKEVEKIRQLISETTPDIVIYCLGTPKQEYFMYKYYKSFNVPVSIGLGATLDFEAGNVKRAPKWMSNCGLEWFFRLLHDPKRLFKRYLIDDLAIIRLIFKYW